MCVSLERSNALITEDAGSNTSHTLAWNNLCISEKFKPLRWLLSLLPTFRLEKSLSVAVHPHRRTNAGTFTDVSPNPQPSIHHQISAVLLAQATLSTWRCTRPQKNPCQLADWWVQQVGDFWHRLLCHNHSENTAISVYFWQKKKQAGRQWVS